MPNGNGNGNGNGGSLVTTSSLLTYSGAAAAVIAIWTIAKQLDVTSRWAAVAIALLAAVVIQLLADPVPARVKGRLPRALVWAFLVIANTAILTSVELGINETVDPAGGQ
jgi:hypothetical protein